MEFYGIKLQPLQIAHDRLGRSVVQLCMMRWHIYLKLNQEKRLLA